MQPRPRLAEAPKPCKEGPLWRGDGGLHERHLLFKMSGLWQCLDEQVKAFLDCPLDHGRYPYIYLDARYPHGMLSRNLRVKSQAMVVATGINDLGCRAALDIALGDSEVEGFWRQYLVSQKERRVTGTRLVISDAHLGHTGAIKRMLRDCA